MAKSDNEILKNFGAHLKKLRKTRRLTLRDLAYSTGISYGKIGHMERGGINITILTAVRLAEALEVDPAALISRKALNL